MSRLNIAVSKVVSKGIWFLGNVVPKVVACCTGICEISDIVTVTMQNLRRVIKVGTIILSALILSVVGNELLGMLRIFLMGKVD